MPDLLAWLLAVSLPLNLWLFLFLVVLLRDRADLAPARSGGGTPAAEGLGPTGSPALPTPR